MRQFFVRLKSETLASVSRSREEQQSEERAIWKFTWEPPLAAALVLYDWLRKEDGIRVHDGLGLDLLVRAGDDEEAFSTARNLAEGVINLISYSTATACKEAALISRYEIPARIGDTRFTHQLQSPTQLFGDTRPIDREVFARVFSCYDAADMGTKSRLSRAMQWLRKGSMEQNAVDQFMSYWVGLEAVSSLVLEALSIPPTELFPTCSKCKEQITECPECGNTLGRPNEMQGVAELFALNIEGGREAYKRIRSNRGRLFHGGKELTPEFLEAIKGDVPVLRQALSTAIGVCLGLERAEFAKIAAIEPRRAVRPLSFRIKGLLKDFLAPSLDNPGRQPMLENEPSLKYSLTPSGELNIAFEQTVTMRNGSFQPQESEIWGDKHSRAIQ